MINIQVDPSDLRVLQNLSRRFPRETYKGLGRAASVIRGKLRGVMRGAGGKDGVPKFEPLNPFTIQKRRTAGSRSSKIGGALARASAIQMFRKGNKELTVGFVSGLAPWASMLQEADNRDMSKAERLRFWRLGVYPSPNTYNRPAREIIEPFAGAMGGELSRLAIANTKKILSGARK